MEHSIIKDMFTASIYVYLICGAVSIIMTKLMLPKKKVRQAILTPMVFIVFSMISNMLIIATIASNVNAVETKTVENKQIYTEVKPSELIESKTISFTDNGALRRVVCDATTPFIADSRDKQYILADGFKEDFTGVWYIRSGWAEENNEITYYKVKEVHY